MLDPLSPAVAIVAAMAWLMLFVTGYVRVRRNWLNRSGGAGAGAYPELLLRGIMLVGLGPSVSVIHYLASHGEAFWGGAVILVTGFALIALHLLLKQRRIDDERIQRTTFREKSVLAQFCGILLAFGFYGARLWGQPLSQGAATRALMGVAVLLIIVNVLAHIAIRIYASPEPPDERDLAIVRRGTRNAYYVLGVGVWIILVFATAPLFQPQMFYVLAGMLALAELVRLGSQLLYYRMGT